MPHQAKVSIAARVQRGGSATLGPVFSRLSLGPAKASDVQHVRMQKLPEMRLQNEFSVSAL